MSSSALIECVPNISEGRDRAVIDEIVAAAARHARILDLYVGESTNRSVITMAAPPGEIEQAAFAVIEATQRLIDMRQHRGSHPRMGATDVCPFVPLRGVTMQECIHAAHTLSARVARELSLPVYLYGEAASCPERRSLAYVRKGQYEGLAARAVRGDLLPDFGDLMPQSRFGAVAIGARFFLLAWNINLESASVELATEIAHRLRGSGHPTHPERGIRLKHCSAIGWFLPEHGRAQVSTNLSDFRITPPHLVLDHAYREAAQLGIRITGSELVGLVPAAALRAAGEYYLTRAAAQHSPQHGAIDTAILPCSDEQLLEAAVHGLGLSDLKPFLWQKRIIEKLLES